MSGLPAIGTRLEESAIAAFSAQDVRDYALASGDDNPLHIDPALAARAGFAAPPVQGMLVMAALDAALRGWRPDLHVARLSATFVQPLLTGEAARISGRILRHEGDAVLMRLLAQGPERAPVVIAEARLVERAPTS